MNVPPIRSRKSTPEGIIQDALIDFLSVRGWFVRATHGNLYQSGFPDLYATHYSYGARWIEVKNPTGYTFTPAQLECFPKFSANGTGIWILTAATQAEYEKLWLKPNWWVYLHCEGASHLEIKT